MTLRNSLVYEEISDATNGQVLETVWTIGRLKETLDAYWRSRKRDAGQHSRAERFELEVRQALADGTSFSVASISDGRADFLVEVPEGTIAIILKSRRSGTVGIKDIKEWLNLGSDSLRWGTVVVTDAHRTAELQDIGALQLSNGRSVRVVQWTGPADIPQLIKAITRVVASERELDTRSSLGNNRGRFEIYTDRAGKFHVRLKASNGQVIATGEAYESKAAAVNAIEYVQRITPTASIEDRTSWLS